MSDNHKIAVIGLGYVGLPLAVEFAKKFKVIGYDINKTRIDELLNGSDSTLEISNEKLLSVISSLTDDKGLFLSNDVKDLCSSNIYIVTVPTPIDSNNSPLLTPLLSASEMIGSVLKVNDIVIYESTVFPGCTEEDCVPVLENASKLKFNKDFFCGYSPERINPGDKKHTVTKIKKITSGSTPRASKIIDDLYSRIIKAGTFSAPSIKVAEAAKVIENSQRDINIAFVNELAKIFNKLDIDTNDVLEAASTKWNFLNFSPGLVGGHCIGVDPYYLAQKAQKVGYNPEIILSGRRMNDSMGEYIVSQIIKKIILRGLQVNGLKTLILGITFKENCPDIRNTKVVDIINELYNFSCNVDIYDPWVNVDEVSKDLGINVIKEIDYKQKYELIILAVSHSEFLDLDINKLKKNNKSFVYDVKGFLRDDFIDERL